MSGHRRTRTVRRSASVAAACAAAVAFGLAGGLLVRALAAGPEPERPVATRVVSAGPARITVPQTWQTVRTGRMSVVLAPAPPLPQRVHVTVEPADRPSLIGRSFRTRIRDRSPRPRSVDVAGHAAWEYTGLVDRRGDELLDVTVVPAREHVVNVACVSPLEDAGSMLWCASGIGALTVGDAPTLVPAPDLALQLQLPRVLARLDRARREERAALGSARRHTVQQATARRLAGAHADAGDALRPVAGEAGEPLVRELLATAGAYRALARAIAGPSPSRLRAARRAAQATDARLSSAVGAVVRRPLLESPVVTTAQAPAPADRSGGRWPFILLLLALTSVLVLLARRRRTARPELARPPEARPPQPREPLRSAARWDAPPPGLNARSGAGAPRSRASSR